MTDMKTTTVTASTDRRARANTRNRDRARDDRRARVALDGIRYARVDSIDYEGLLEV